MLAKRATPAGRSEHRRPSLEANPRGHQDDAKGSLIAVNLPDGRLIEYVTDGKGRRIGKKVNGTLTKQWIYDGQLRIIAEQQFDATGNPSVMYRFVYGSRSNTPEVAIVFQGSLTIYYRIFSDHLGSPRYVSRPTATGGKRLLEASYSAFGIPTSIGLGSALDTIPFGFAGGLYDADTGLVRFGARDYDPRFGRWVSKDPILFRGRQANLCVYVGNDPVNNVDPTGLTNWSAAESQAFLDEAIGEYSNQNIMGGLASALENSSGLGNSGQYDFKTVTAEDTFDVAGLGETPYFNLNAGEFGNYFAGYVNYGAFGDFGLAATFAGGHVFSLSQYHIIDSWLDRALIARGAYDFQRKHGRGGHWSGYGPNICPK